ncbi:MAG: VOC family protein [Bacteroidetes bacterium]|nr:VOC family protein [Bacteroidota bacterium]
MKFICPLITVNDIKRSRYFYEEVLGQKVIADFGENITFQGDFAIHLKEHFQSLLEGNEIIHGRNNFELYFEDDDPEPIVERLKAYGSHFVHELREQPWRQRVVRFHDPDGNLIEIGESMEHVSWRLYQEGIEMAEICRITYMPEEFVRKAITKYNG